MKDLPIQKCEKQIKKNRLRSLENFDSRCETIASALEIGLSSRDIEEQSKTERGAVMNVHNAALSPIVHGFESISFYSRCLERFG